MLHLFLETEWLVKLTRSLPNPLFSSGSRASKVKLECPDIFLVAELWIQFNRTCSIESVKRVRVLYVEKSSTRYLMISNLLNATILRLLFHYGSQDLAIGILQNQLNGKTTNVIVGSLPTISSSAPSTDPRTKRSGSFERFPDIIKNCINSGRQPDAF